MSDQIKGSLALLLATFTYGMYGILSHMAGQEFGSFSQNFSRTLIILIPLSIYIILSNSWVQVTPTDRVKLLLWTLTGSTVMILLFISFNNIPIGTNYFLFHSGMISSGYIFGKLAFGEKLNKSKIASLILAFTGIGLIYSLSAGADLIYYILALTSGFLSGTWTTFTKKFSDYYPNIQLVFIDSLVTVLVSLLGLLIFGDSVPAFSFSIAWFGVLLLAISYLVASALVIYGYRHLEAQVGSVIMPLEIVFGALSGLIFLGETIPLFSVIGGLFIVAGAFLPNIVALIRPRPQ